MWIKVAYNELDKLVVLSVWRVFRYLYLILNEISHIVFLNELKMELVVKLTYF